MITIIVYGNSSVGKTTVINQVYNEFLKNGAKISQPHKPLGGNPKDFEVLIEYKNKKIAFFSMGDFRSKTIDGVNCYSSLCDVLIVAYNSKFETIGANVIENSSIIHVVKKHSATNADNDSAKAAIISLI